MAAKYQQYLQEMMESHKEIFEKFKHIHDAYALFPEKFQKELNEKGQEILEIIRRYENMLCNQSEGGKYGKFSSKLSEKFWEAIRAIFPKIDYIGLE